MNIQEITGYLIQDSKTIKKAQKAFKHARDVIGGEFPEGEAAIKRSPKYVYYYAYDVIKGRWPAGEKSIARDPRWAHRYALDVIEGRFPEAEELIAQSAHHATFYARNVIGGRWPEPHREKAEATIKKDPLMWSIYEKLVKHEI